VTIAADGQLQGIEDAAAQAETGEAAVAFLSHLLALLALFVGEALMLRLVREGWPDADIDLQDSEKRRRNT
jgi:hypothetical protein